MPNTALLIKNPLAATHEFKQACQLCYPKTGNVTPETTPLCPQTCQESQGLEVQNRRTLVCQWEIGARKLSPSKVGRGGVGAG